LSIDSTASRNTSRAMMPRSAVSNVWPNMERRSLGGWTG
jgi:hypothetical protein